MPSAVIENENNYLINPAYDEDLGFELFQVLPRVTGERDVVEVERQ